MNVLVTGGAGFVGSAVVPTLVSSGHQVRIVDFGMFGFDHVHREAETICGDIIDIKAEWLEGIDAVIHLAGLSNDPMAAFSPSLNYQLNASGTAIVAEASKAEGISRFIFASSCSVYGLSDSLEVDEDFDAKPSFPYAISKLMGERALECLADDTFKPIVLRKGTVVGPSPRMRFDLVVNTMVKTAITEGVIRVHNPSLWRPIIDTRDAASAYLAAVEAAPSVEGTFNIAHGNYSIGELADAVALVLRESGRDVAIEVANRPDMRSYRVATTRAAHHLGFRPRISLEETVWGILDQIEKDGITDFEEPVYHNVQQMERWFAGDGTGSQIHD